MAIMISIRPEFVEKILNKQKVLEIRKNIPKCDLPQKVYIYCTKAKPFLYRVDDDDEFELSNELIFDDYHEEYVKDYNPQNGRVCAEFTLKEYDFFKMPMDITKEFQEKSCVNGEQLMKYLDGDYFKSFYAWHIDDLVVYDKPKELGEFSYYIKDNKCPTKECGISCEDCSSYDEEHNTCLELYYLHRQVKRPPQSYMFVEELEE